MFSNLQCAMEALRLLDFLALSVFPPLTASFVQHVPNRLQVPSLKPTFSSSRPRGASTEPLLCLPRPTEDNPNSLNRDRVHRLCQENISLLELIRDALKTSATTRNKLLFPSPLISPAMLQWSQARTLRPRRSLNVSISSEILFPEARPPLELARRTSDGVSVPVKNGTRRKGDE